MEIYRSPIQSIQPDEIPVAYRVENPSELFKSYEEQCRILTEKAESVRPILRNEIGEPVFGPPTLHESAQFILAKNEILVFDQTRDSLTGALNREGFKEVLNRRLGQISRQTPTTSVVDLLMFMDTDRFKAVNDIHGHHAGDFVLQALASTLALEHTLRTKPDTKRSPDAVARLGGDEFAALIQNVPQEESSLVIDRIKKTLDSVEIPYRTIDKELILEVGMSIGIIAIKHGSQVDLSEALRAADVAMYEEKQKRHPQSVFEKLMSRIGWVRKRGR